MRSLAYWLSLAFILTVPWEMAVSIDGLGRLSRAAGLLSGGMWLLTVLMTGRLRKLAPFHVLVFVFVVWNAASVLWTLDAEVTSERVVSLLQMALLILILWDLYTTREAVHTGLQAYVLGAYVTALLNIRGYIQDDDAVRYTVGAATANGTGTVLVLAMPIAWHLASSPRATALGRLLRIVNFAYLPLGTFATALTASRFAMLAMVPASLFGIFTLARLRPIARLLAATAAVLVVVLLPSLVPERSLERVATADEEIAHGDLNRRTVFWKEGLELWQENVVLGVGGGAFAQAVESGRSAHNSFVSVLTELGLVGLALYALIWASSLGHAWAQPRWEAWFWITVLVVLGMANSTITMVHTKRNWLFFGLLAASWAAEAAEKLSPEPRSVPGWSPGTPTPRTAWDS